MPLMGFSDKKHVPMLLNGTKKQTTRKPRKNKIKTGDVLHCYFKPRMKKSCSNCISEECPSSVQNQTHTFLGDDCQKHINYFGTAITTSVLELEGYNTFAYWDREALEKWAIADGFENFREADEWFRRVHGNDWQYMSWNIIYFEGDWLKEV